MICVATKKDGTPCKAKVSVGDLCVFHNRMRPETELEALERKRASEPTGAPAILAENRRVQGTKMEYGHRSITFLRPICDLCQDGNNVNPRWYLNCLHDPYMGVSEQLWEEPQYQVEADGTRTIVGRVQKSRLIPLPNWAEISVTNRINGGLGADMARNKGFIRPSELRNELYPNGIAECCEWSDCRWQKDLVEYKHGRFCREREARLAIVDARGTGSGRWNLEIGWDAQSKELRESQLAGISVQ